MSAKDFGRELYRSITDAAVSDSAAGLTYYMLFALFPFLTCIVTLGAYLPVGDAAQQLVARLQGVVPPAAMQIIHGQLDALLHRPKPHLLTLGLLLAIYTASKAANAFRKALNLAYDVHESRPAWKTKSISLLFTILAVALMLLGIAMIAAGGRVGLWVANHVGISKEFQFVWSWLRWPTTALVIMLLAALAYYLLPDVQQRFKYISPGSVLSSVLWLLATWGFTVYVDNFGNYSNTYGALGGAIILLTLLYLSAYLFVLGGHVNAVIEHLAPEGKAIGAKRFGEPAKPLEERPSASPPGALDSASVAARAHARNGHGDGHDPSKPPHH